MEEINLQEHNPEWLTRFAEEAKLLQQVLGEKLIAIHHVGSTAVAGLLAKPIVDIAMECTHYPPSSDVHNRLLSIGYTGHGESGVSGRYWYTKGQPRRFNLHLCQTGSSVVRQQLTFRDELIKSSALRAEYAALKQTHSRGRHIDDTEYAASKSSLIRRVLSDSGQR